MSNATLVFNNETLGILKIATIIEGGIEPGNEEVFSLIFDVDESAVSGEYDLNLSNILAANISTDKKAMIIITEDYESLPRIGQLLPHYGKYSYLVFKGAKNIAKGQWPITDSPLKVTLK